MKSNQLKELNMRLNSLCVFRDLLSDSVISSLVNFLNSLESGEELRKISDYSAFVFAVYGSREATLAGHIRSIVSNSENVYVKSIGGGRNVSPMLKKSVDAEIQILQAVADLMPADLCETIEQNIFLPEFESEKIDLAADYAHRTENISKFGYGIYAVYHMFRVDGGKIVPVLNPDNISLDELVDYRREQQTVVDNTVALLDGRPAANILLTGDAGTGKSSTIKAVVNGLYRDGLRIIEVRKEQLREIPAILDELSENPLKFILFIDDLSFRKDDDNFSALKAVLEGSVSAKSKNVVIYATSNRRHLVKENFSDREGDDVHFNDTLQEIISLSERFGIQITFNRPDKKTYLDIVHHLADAKGVEYNAEEIDILAERFALARGTRSARAAKQFVDSLL